MKTRKRSCTRPAPRGGGTYCRGPPASSTKCNENACPGNIVFICIRYTLYLDVYYISFHHYEKQTYLILKLETTIKDDVPSSTQPVSKPSKPPQATTIHSSPTHIPNNGKFKSKQPLGFLLYQTKKSPSTIYINVFTDIVH